MKVMVGVCAALMACACASGPDIASGPRPPQGPGPAGTQFGFWDRDADAAVDASFRAYVTRTYNAGDEAKAQAALTQDGFACEDGLGSADKPGPTLSCERLYRDNEIVHSWTVDFVSDEREPRAHYSRIQRRDDLRDRDEKRQNRAGG
jgi:hypothetical protein